jgi:hypothetical protein
MTASCKYGNWYSVSRRATCKVRGLTLLLRAWTLWRCGDGLFFEVPHLASDAFLTTLHPLLGNVLQTVDHFEISCLGSHFSWLEKPKIRMGRDLNWILGLAWKNWISENPIRTSTIQFRSRHMRFLNFSNYEKVSSKARNFDVTNCLQHVFEKWVERCKKCIAC